MNAARLAVYIARNTTANIAHIFVINRAVNPLGESTWTDACEYYIEIIIIVSWSPLVIGVVALMYLKQHRPHDPVSPT